MQKDKQARKSAKPMLKAFTLLGLAFAAGSIPTVTNLVVDPYQVLRTIERPTAINDLAEKSHYPLWKLAKYEVGKFDTIILGDSRARALRDKYWREGGIPTALNLAYGGGTIPEIYSTFRYIRNDAKIRRLVVGIQLRSFDEDHKAGMNRVPEAVELLSNPFSYLKNWHVAKTAVDVLKAENPDAAARVNGFIDRFSMAAKAANLGDAGETPLDTLLEPKVCFGCDLPDGLTSVPELRAGAWVPGSGGKHYRGMYSHLDSRLHGRSLPSYYVDDLSALSAANAAALPKKFQRQVTRNGASDWRNFEESQNYWQYLNTISAWAKRWRVELVFVIPPTIAAMQKTIADNGLGSNNHALRERLSKLGKVIDFDFPNSLTAEIGNFNDAYHFNSKVARAIVEQVIGNFNNTRKPKKRKYAFDLKCPEQSISPLITLQLGELTLNEATNCRTWEVSQ